MLLATVITQTLTTAERLAALLTGYARLGAGRLSTPPQGRRQLDTWVGLLHMSAQPEVPAKHSRTVWAFQRLGRHKVSKTTTDTTNNDNYICLHSKRRIYIHRIYLSQVNELK